MVCGLSVGRGLGQPAESLLNHASAPPRPPPAHPSRSQVGGSGVLVQPMTYIFDEEPARWKQLLENLGVSADGLNIK